FSGVIDGIRGDIGSLLLLRNHTLQGCRDSRRKFRPSVDRWSGGCRCCFLRVVETRNGHRCHSHDWVFHLPGRWNRRSFHTVVRPAEHSGPSRGPLRRLPLLYDRRQLDHRSHRCWGDRVGSVPRSRINRSSRPPRSHRSAARLSLRDSDAHRRFPSPLVLAAAGSIFEEWKAAARAPHPLRRLLSGLRPGKEQARRGLLYYWYGAIWRANAECGACRRQQSRRARRVGTWSDCRGSRRHATSAGGSDSCANPSSTEGRRLPAGPNAPS
ncbi:hypothetical protein PENTCL1PPCAC_5432, partial [Pristionchus entomophagus]